MNISTVQNNNTNFRCLYKPQKKLSQRDLMNLWDFRNYNDWLLQQPAKRLPNILIAHAKQFKDRYFHNCFDIEQAKRDISKPFVNLLLGK